MVLSSCCLRLAHIPTPAIAGNVAVLAETKGIRAAWGVKNALTFEIICGAVITVCSEVD